MQNFLDRAGLGLIMVVFGCMVLVVRNVPVWRDHEFWHFMDGGMSRRTNNIIAAAFVLVGFAVSTVGLLVE